VKVIVTLAIVLGVLTIGLAGPTAVSSTSPTPTPVVKKKQKKAAPAACADHRRGLAFYRARYHVHLAERGARTPYSSMRKARNCADARFLAILWRGRASVQRHKTEAFFRRLNEPTAAICYVFMEHCSQALRVSWCESRHSTRAQNGQYLGLFQMGSWERATFGHSHTALGQARAAHTYFALTGYDWSPWACKP